MGVRGVLRIGQSGFVGWGARGWVFGVYFVKRVRLFGWGGGGDAEVGAVAHDEAVDVIDGGGEGVFPGFGLGGCELGDDGVGVIELGEVIEAVYEEDEVWAGAGGGLEDFEGGETGLLCGGGDELADGLHEGVHGAGAYAVLEEHVEWLGLVVSEEGEVAQEDEGGLVVGDNGRVAACGEGFGFVGGEAFVGVFALVVVEEGGEGEEGEVAVGFAEGGGGEDEAGGSSAFDDGDAVVVVGGFKLGGGAGADDGVFKEEMRGAGGGRRRCRGGLGWKIVGGDAEDSDVEGKAKEECRFVHGKVYLGQKGEVAGSAK